MAWASMHFRSKTLNMPVEAEVLIPQAGYKSLKQQGNYKVMVLLHGVRNDRTEWLLKSQIFEMVKELPVLVFLPSGKNSFYLNTHAGYHYRDYITQEIPELIKMHFPVSKCREDWLIGGDSMGGYGAVLGGLHRPDVYGNIASFSGALDLKGLGKAFPEFGIPALLGPAYEAFEQDENNVYHYCRQVEEGRRPRIYLCCGSEDGLLEENRRFYDLIRDMYDVQAVWGQGGHDFLYWNERLKEVMKWFCPEEIKAGFFMGRCGNDLI